MWKRRKGKNFNLRLTEPSTLERRRTILENTYKLYRTKTKDVIFRRNVYFNERSFLGRKLQPIANLQDDGTDLIGSDFEDYGILWTGTKTGF
jgi:hypothetical protein